MGKMMAKRLVTPARWYFTPFIIVVVLLLGGCDININYPSIADMLSNVEQSYPPIWRLLTACSYVMGIYFIVRGVFKLKVYGDMRTMMSNNASMKPVLITMLVGSSLLYWPTMLDLMLNTFWHYGREGVLSYQKKSTDAERIMSSIIGLIRILGFVSFLRGWVMLAKTAEGNAQQGVFSKGIIHLTAGVFAINILGFAKVLGATIGVTTT